MIRTTRLCCALAALTALTATATACGKEGSPPAKGPPAERATPGLSGVHAPTPPAIDRYPAS